MDGATVAKIEAGTRSLKVTELLALLDYTQTNTRTLMQVAPDVRHWYEADEIARGAQFDVELRAGAELDVERRAAARLGISPVQLDELSHQLWGHAFSEERDRRADGMDRGGKSHVVRQMLVEVQEVLG